VSTSHAAPVAPQPVTPRRGGPVGDFVTGVSFLLRGLGTYARSPGMMLLGLLPAVISFTLLVLSFLGMFRYWAPDLAELVTPFADGWAAGARDAVRVLATGAILLVWVVLSILLFTALTLTVGQPFYEAISKKVEDRLGGVPGEINVSFWKTLPRSILDSVRLLVFALFVAVFVLLIGVIPVVGQIGAAVMGALLGGWLLAVEITSVPFERRGLKLRDRRRTLKSRRAMSLGFGVATFVCFLVPLGAVLMMPAAVAGGTLLSLRLLGQPDAGA
jgi:CysZ protein